MRKPVAIVLALAVVLMAGYLLGACVLGDFTVLPPDADGGGGGGEAGSGKPNGGACSAGSECSSSNCADGVCCDTACSGTCEKCNTTAAPGVCVAIPDGQDPDKECATKPLPPPPADDAGAPGDAAAAEGGTTFEIPDAGLTQDDNMCAGSCNGKRACGFAGKERTCGAVFCGNATEQGRASCDGKGHCLYGIEECSAYSCPNGSPGCKKTCVSEQDCLSTHFCDVGSTTCKAKVANGSACTSVTQCQSGNCVEGVCCNSLCDIAGGTCTKMGSVGKCICSACPTGECALYYQDLDGDTYGNANGKIGDGTAAYGCIAGPAPVGYVANKLDCFDAVGAIAASVHPNQAAGVYYQNSYTIPGGSASFDYDCDSFESKETLEFASSTGCGYCHQRQLPLVGCQIDAKCTTAGEASGLGCKSSIFINSCNTNTTPGFAAVIPCGSTGTKYTCGTCGAAGGMPSQTTQAGVFQRCR